MLKYQIVRDCLPKNKPLRHIRTFEDFCQTLLFPFVEIISSEDKKPQQDYESFSDMIGNFDSHGENVPSNKTPKQKSSKEIEFSGLPYNLLAEHRQ